MPDSLEIQFHAAMENIYHRAKKEVGYNATLFRRMVAEHGGLETARKLIVASQVSEGYIALWEHKRLDLTVEAMILNNPEYHSLFSPEELDICRNRLREYGYNPVNKQKQT